MGARRVDRHPVQRQKLRVPKIVGRRVHPHDDDIGIRGRAGEVPGPAVEAMDVPAGRGEGAGGMASEPAAGAGDESGLAGHGLVSFQMMRGR
jgi:hypothetical protein